VVAVHPDRQERKEQVTAAKKSDGKNSGNVRYRGGEKEKSPGKKTWARGKKDHCSGDPLSFPWAEDFHLREGGVEGKGFKEGCFFPESEPSMGEREGERFHNKKGKC